MFVWGKGQSEAKKKKLSNGNDKVIKLDESRVSIIKSQIDSLVNRTSNLTFFNKNNINL